MVIPGKTSPRVGPQRTSRQATAHRTPSLTVMGSLPSRAPIAQGGPTPAVLVSRGIRYFRRSQCAREGETYSSSRIRDFVSNEGGSSAVDEQFRGSVSNCIRAGHPHGSTPRAAHRADTPRRLRRPPRLRTHHTRPAPVGPDLHRRLGRHPRHPHPKRLPPLHHRLRNRRPHLEPLPPPPGHPGNAPGHLRLPDRRPEPGRPPRSTPPPRLPPRRTGTPPLGLDTRRLTPPAGPPHRPRRPLR